MAHTPPKRYPFPNDADIAEYLEVATRHYLLINAPSANDACRLFELNLPLPWPNHPSPLGEGTRASALLGLESSFLDRERYVELTRGPRASEETPGKTLNGLGSYALELALANFSESSWSNSPTMVTRILSVQSAPLTLDADGWIPGPGLSETPLREAFAALVEQRELAGSLPARAHKAAASAAAPRKLGSL